MLNFRGKGIKNAKYGEEKRKVMKNKKVSLSNAIVELQSHVFV